MKRPVLTALIWALGSVLWAEVGFGSLDLNSKNQLIFQASAHVPGNGTFKSHFLADIAKGKLETLTIVPEKILYLPKTGQLQIQNRYGVYRTSPTGEEIAVVSQEAFVKKNQIASGKLLPIQSSQDGRFLTYLKESSPIEGELILYEVANGTAFTVSDKIPLNFSRVPVLWSPDSQFFVYEKNAEIYYFSMKQKSENRLPAEKLRSLGSGLLNCVSWGPAGELYYLWDNILYRILPEEFFTRSLYAGIFRVGGIIGKLPMRFTPETDQFWLSPGKDQILLSLGGRLLFLYQLDYLDFYQGESLIPLSYIPLPENLLIKKVLWDAEGNITLLTASLTSGRDFSQVLRIKGNDTKILIAPQEDEVKDILLSPSGKSCVLVQAKGLTLYDYKSFQSFGTIAHPGTLSVIWKDEAALIIAGQYSTIEYSLQAATRRLLLLGEVDQAGYAEGGLLGARREKSYYFYRGKGIWQETVALNFALPQNVNADYRVYVEDLSTGLYDNMVMVRDLKGLANTPLFPKPQQSYEPFPLTEERSDEVLFSHGSRLRAREIAFAIDAEDTSEGLTELLRALKEYDFKATFFINGEFLRRNNGASREIAASGHETGSLFYILYDMSDPRFALDADFIKKGLARQEDDYFTLTGKELGLLWHTPGYFSNKIVLDSARSMNYQFIGTDVPVMAAAGRRVDTGDLIMRILGAKKPGSIIPLTLGLKDSKTGESFFSRIDLLFNALRSRGYEAVTVTALRDEARK